jgi:hypothetical protein
MEHHDNNEHVYAHFVGDRENGRNGIEALERLGAHNPFGRTGDNPDMLYYIAHDNNIHGAKRSNAHNRALIEMIEEVGEEVQTLTAGHIHDMTDAMQKGGIHE